MGGIWRALAHVDMDEQNYPLSILHHYVIPAGRAIKLCRVVAGLSRKSLEKMRSVPKRRAEALPYGALVMEEMLRSFNLKQVVISAYGLREGVLQTRLPAEERGKDPLIEFARDANRRDSRTEAHAPGTIRLDADRFSRKESRARDPVTRGDLPVLGHRLETPSR